METLFTPQYQWLWTFVLGLALFFPVRKLIWILTVRRAQKKAPQAVNDAEIERLRKRAGVTAGLLCVPFAVFYVDSLFRS